MIPDENSRIVPSRKEAIVHAVHSGELPLSECLNKYSMSWEEFISLDEAVESGDKDRLKSTKIQRFRK